MVESKADLLDDEDAPARLDMDGKTAQIYRIINDVASGKKAAK